VSFGRSRLAGRRPGAPALLAAALIFAGRSAALAQTAPAAAEGDRLAERAHQDRTIVYFLRPPESHAFDLYHDYTESRPGVDRYLNVVRKGSAASGPSARNLDTGETLRVETLSGDAVLKARKLSHGAGS